MVTLPRCTSGTGECDIVLSRRANNGLERVQQARVQSSYSITSSTTAARSLRVSTRGTGRGALVRSSKNGVG